MLFLTGSSNIKEGNEIITSTLGIVDSAVLAIINPNTSDLIETKTSGTSKKKFIEYSCYGIDGSKEMLERAKKYHWTELRSGMD